jgi:hypothetical protein
MTSSVTTPPALARYRRTFAKSQERVCTGPAVGPVAAGMGESRICPGRMDLGHGFSVPWSWLGTC